MGKTSTIRVGTIILAGILTCIVWNTSSAITLEELHRLDDSTIEDLLKQDTEKLRVPATRGILAEALTLLNEERYDEAIDKVRQVLQTSPRSAPAYEILGAALLKKGELDQGLEALNRAVELNPKQSSAITKIGDVYLARKQYKEATAQFLKAIQIDPDDRRAHQRLGILYEREGQDGLAIEHYEKGLIGTPPGYVGIKVNLGRLYNNRRQYTKTLSLLEGLVKMDACEEGRCGNNR